MTQTASLAPLAEAHAFHPAAQDAITLRYDAGRDADGDPVVYAVLSCDDLRKLPADLLSGLGIGADREDGQGDPAFFVGDDTSLRLYVDTDSYPSFKADLIDVADDMGIPLRDAQGDLKLMTAGTDDIVAPDMPAFVHAGMERVDTATAIATIHHQHELDMRTDRKADRDDPGSQSF